MKKHLVEFVISIFVSFVIVYGAMLFFLWMGDREGVALKHEQFGKKLGLIFGGLFSVYLASCSKEGPPEYLFGVGGRGARVLGAIVGIILAVILS